MSIIIPRSQTSIAMERRLNGSGQRTTVVRPLSTTRSTNLTPRLVVGYRVQDPMSLVSVVWLDLLIMTPLQYVRFPWSHWLDLWIRVLSLFYDVWSSLSLTTAEIYHGTLFLKEWKGNLSYKSRSYLFTLVYLMVFLPVQMQHTCNKTNIPLLRMWSHRPYTGQGIQVSRIGRQLWRRVWASHVWGEHHC